MKKFIQNKTTPDSMLFTCYTLFVLVPSLACLLAGETSVAAMLMIFGTTTTLMLLST